MRTECASLAAAAIFALVVWTPAIEAQAQVPQPQFEEASIRPCDQDNIPEPPAGSRGGGANSFQMTPGRTHAVCMTLATIIRHAYGYGPAAINPGGRGRGLAMNNVYGLGVEDGVRVRGGPDWVRSERYTIDAVADGAADASTMSGPMLQDLLERRFKLKVHIDTEQMQAVALTVAAGGLKIKPVQGGCELPPPPAPGQRSVVQQRSAAGVRRGERPYCGAWPRRVGPNIVVVAGEGTMSELVTLVATTLGRGGRGPVVDRTGNTQKFNFALEFAIDENTPGASLFNFPGDDPGADVPRAPTMSTALEEQLGLRLEPAKAPREFIVIDQIERLTPD